jgi:hypothetical protein
MKGGPLSYASNRPVSPISLGEKAALAFAGCGLTGYTLGDLPYESSLDGGGNILIHLLGRTVPSGDGAHTIALFMMDDEGTWWLRRPQDFEAADVGEVIAANREGRLTDSFLQSRHQISRERATVPLEVPNVLPFNRWSTNRPGGVTFLPVAEVSALAINIALAAFSEEFAYFVVDERNGFRPAGLRKFALSRGGHLDDNPEHGKVATVGLGEVWLSEFAAIEQGAVLQNLGLMTEALGLGGFAFFAAHPYAWTRALGFRLREVPFSQSVGAGLIWRLALRLLRKDMPIPYAIGLEHQGAVLMKPFCPPYYSSMEQAVLAFVDYKFSSSTGSLTGVDRESAWRDQESIKAAIPRPSDRTIEATIAYCDYIYRRYGRFPLPNGPFRTVLGFEVHRPDREFYQMFYGETSLQLDH